MFEVVKPGALLENISFDNGTNEPNYEDGSATQNTRVSHPVHHIRILSNIVEP